MGRNGAGTTTIERLLNMLRPTADSVLASNLDQPQASESERGGAPYGTAAARKNSWPWLVPRVLVNGKLPALV
jgi:hypothetical protein